MLHLFWKASKISTGYFVLSLAGTSQRNWMQGKLDLSSKKMETVIQKIQAFLSSLNKSLFEIQGYFSVRLPLCEISHQYGIKGLFESHQKF